MGAVPILIIGRSQAKRNECNSIPISQYESRASPYCLSLGPMGGPLTPPIWCLPFKIISFHFVNHTALYYFVLFDISSSP